MFWFLKCWCTIMHERIQHSKADVLKMMLKEIYYCVHCSVIALCMTVVCCIIFIYIHIFIFHVSDPKLTGIFIKMNTINNYCKEFQQTNFLPIFMNNIKEKLFVGFKFHSTCIKHYRKSNNLNAHAGSIFEFNYLHQVQLYISFKTIIIGYLSIGEHLGI